jgi:hypothetical protein
MLDYLAPCYEEIVQPMSQEIKKLMVNFQITTEGEFFSCENKVRINYMTLVKGKIK